MAYKIAVMGIGYVGLVNAVGLADFGHHVIGADITGHTGFKGGWLSLWLKELGAKVVGYSLEPPTEPNLFEAINLKDKIIHIIGDVRDEKHLNY